MLGFLFHKMKNKKWMMLALLLGNILLVTTLSSITMYQEAVEIKMLGQELNHTLEEENEYPTTLSLGTTLTVVTRTRHNGDLFQKVEEIAKNLSKDINVGLREFITHYNLTIKTTPDTVRNGKDMKLTLLLGSLSNMEEHITIIKGKGYESSLDGVIPVIVSEQMLFQNKLYLGESLTLENIKGKDGKNLKVHISGIFKEKDIHDIYWVNTPGSYNNMLFISEATMKELFIDYQSPRQSMRGIWHLLFDYEGLDKESAKTLLHKTEELKKQFDLESTQFIEENYLSPLRTYLQNSNKTDATLTSLKVPIMVLLVVFIGMVNKQMFELEKSEISLLKSRGANKLQIFKLYSLMSFLLGLLSIILGVLLGILVSKMIGYSNGFMEFIIREPLSISISNGVLLDCLVSLLLIMAVSSIPTFLIAKDSIVIQKQKLNRRRRVSLWQILGLDIILILISLYVRYNFLNQLDLIEERVDKGLGMDPILYFASSVFIIGVSLFTLRIIPILIRILFKLTKAYLSPAFYASYIQVIRSRRQQDFIIIFLILTISLGIFNAQTARSISENDKNNIKYRAGADIVLQVDESNQASLNEVTKEVPLTKVLRLTGSIEGASKEYSSIMIQGIDTKEFGETAWFLEDLLDVHWYHYLNALSSDPNHVLVSKNLKEELGYLLSDTIYYTVNGYQLRGIICGFVDYWPNYEGVSYHEFDGTIYEKENYLIVANREFISPIIGKAPEFIYLKSSVQSLGLSEKLWEHRELFSYFNDTNKTIIERKNDPVIQGTNGILTFGFITIFTLCIIGFILYWVLSIRNRTVLLGVMKAMGMSLGEITIMLTNEQLFISLLPIMVGAFVGYLSSKLFIPLVQIGYLTRKNPLPLRIIQDIRDSAWVFSIVFLMLMGCILTLRIMIKKTKIAHALKLGED